MEKSNVPLVPICKSLMGNCDTRLYNVIIIVLLNIQRTFIYTIFLSEGKQILLSKFELTLIKEDNETIDPLK